MVSLDHDLASGYASKLANDESPVMVRTTTNSPHSFALAWAIG
jgi:hypothetical protein